jgi:hypothetical protein
VVQEVAQKLIMTTLPRKFASTDLVAGDADESDVGRFFAMRQGRVADPRQREHAAPMAAGLIQERVGAFMALLAEKIAGRAPP